MSLLYLLNFALVEVGVDTRWMVYPPLDGITNHFEGSIDLANINIHLSSVSFILSSINICNASVSVNPTFTLHLKVIIY